MLADGVVGLRPVDGQAEGAPQRLELLLVLGGELFTQFDEVLAGNRHLILGVNLLAISAFKRRHEIRIVLQGRIHAHAVIVLHTAFGRQAVVVPAHRVEHVVAVHALETCDHIGVRVGRTRGRRAGGPKRWAAGYRWNKRPYGRGCPGTCRLRSRPRLRATCFETVHADLVGQ